MTADDRLDEIEDRLRDPMVTYKENTTQDAPPLVSALRGVLKLHQPVEVPVVTGDCAAEQCDHDECLTYPLTVCGGCMERAEQVSPYAAESADAMATLVYPCPDVQAIISPLGGAS